METYKDISFYKIGDYVRLAFDSQIYKVLSVKSSKKDGYSLIVPVNMQDLKPIQVEHHKNTKFFLVDKI